VSTRSTDAAEEFIDGQSQGVLSSQDQTKQLYAVAGLGIKYPFGRHLEVLFDYTWIRNFKRAPEYVHQEVTGNTWGLTKAFGLGVRYRFNLKKLVE
jgi:hypothetical protein